MMAFFFLPIALGSIFGSDESNIDVVFLPSTRVSTSCFGVFSFVAVAVVDVVVVGRPFASLSIHMIIIIILLQPRFSTSSA